MKQQFFKAIKQLIVEQVLGCLLICALLMACGTAKRMPTREIKMTQSKYDRHPEWHNFQHRKPFFYNGRWHKKPKK